MPMCGNAQKSSRIKLIPVTDMWIMCFQNFIKNFLLIKQIRLLQLEIIIIEVRLFTLNEQPIL